MKFLLSFLTVVMLTEACNSNKEVVSNSSISEETSEVESRKQFQNEKISVTYRASTRGFFELIEIDGDSVSFTNDYNLKRVHTIAIPQDPSTTAGGTIGGNAFAGAHIPGEFTLWGGTFDAATLSYSNPATGSLDASPQQSIEYCFTATPLLWIGGLAVGLGDYREHDSILVRRKGK